MGNDVPASVGSEFHDSLTPLLVVLHWRKEELAIPPSTTATVRLTILQKTPPMCFAGAHFLRWCLACVLGEGPIGRQLSVMCKSVVVFCMIIKRRSFPQKSVPCGSSMLHPIIHASSLCHDITRGTLQELSPTGRCLLCSST